MCVFTHVIGCYCCIIVSFILKVICVVCVFRVLHELMDPTEPYTEISMLSMLVLLPLLSPILVYITATAIIESTATLPMTAAKANVVVMIVSLYGELCYCHPIISLILMYTRLCAWYSPAGVIFSCPFSLSASLK